MWGMFIGSVLVGALFLYAPGFLMLRGIRLPGLTALACAPLVSIPAYMLLCLAYEKLGVFSSWLSLFGALILLSCVVFAVGSLVGRGKGLRLGVEYSPFGSVRSKETRWWASSWAVLGLYAVTGLVIGSLCFVVTLDGPNSFLQAYDNVHHLGVTRSFVESGNWSPFAAALYATPVDSAINPLPGLGFYPTAWNCMAALLVSALGVSTMLAANAVNLLFVAVVFPLSMFVLMRTMFPEQPKIVAFGSLCVLAFGAFPWMLLLFGPLYPNMIALCVTPLVAFCFMSFFSCGVGRASRVVVGVLFCAGVLCCAFAQPNAVFTVAVFLIPFCIRQAVLAADFLSVPPERKRLTQIGLGIGAFLLISVVWFALYKAPFLQSVVNHSWPAVSSKPEAVFDFLSLGFRAAGAQIALGILVIIGGLYTLRNRKYLWLGFSYALLGLLYVVSVSSDGPLQHLLTGFWYTDSFRLAASAALFGTPLAALGLGVVFEICCHLVQKVSSARPTSRLMVGSACAVSLVFVAAVYGPALTNATFVVKGDALDSTLAGLRFENNAEAPHVYDSDEQAFVQKVREVVPSDALILNVPDDGSAFSYGVDGLRTYYRYLRTYGEDDETEASKLIRNHLSEISSDNRVRDAVAELGASYLMTLDEGQSQYESPRLFTYEDGGNWVGIDSIDDSTPGFEVVLSEGDMRLYRIVAAEASTQR